MERHYFKSRIKFPGRNALCEHCNHTARHAIHRPWEEVSPTADPELPVAPIEPFGSLFKAGDWVLEFRRKTGTPGAPWSCLVAFPAGVKPVSYLGGVTAYGTVLYREAPDFVEGGSAEFYSFEDMGRRLERMS